MADRSIVEYFGRGDGHQCGYCKAEDKNISSGMWAHSLSVQDYESLINRGWRRSGHYCYKPAMKETCCPQYTIRCDAKNFTLNHSHKKVLKKMHNYLTDKDSNKNAKNNDPNANKSKVQSQDTSSSSMKNLSQTTEVKIKEENQEQQTSEPARADVSSNAACSNPQKKAKILRLERKLNKLKSKEEIVVLPKPSANENLPKTLEDYLLEEPTPIHNLVIKLVSSSSSEFKESLLETHKLYVKYQMMVHEDKEEECTIEQFKRFLVKTPLQSCKHPDDKTHPGYGSFHQQYWLDGKLIAVGVIDLLPTVLSSVYFFYDPDLNFLSLGTYASLREIAFTRKLNRKFSEFKWYYLGFYLHSCPKMRYKSQYKPSYLLCPETFTWMPIEECLPKLDCNKYSRLNQDDSLIDEEIIDLAEVGVLYKRCATTYAVYQSLNKNKVSDEEEVHTYSSLVGSIPARRMLLFRS